MTYQNLYSFEKKLLKEAGGNPLIYLYIKQPLLFLVKIGGGGALCAHDFLFFYFPKNLTPPPPPKPLNQPVNSWVYFTMEFLFSEKLVYKKFYYIIHEFF